MFCDTPLPPRPPGGAPLYPSRRPPLTPPGVPSSPPVCASMSAKRPPRGSFEAHLFEPCAFLISCISRSVAKPPPFFMGSVCLQTEMLKNRRFMSIHLADSCHPKCLADKCIREQITELVLLVSSVLGRVPRNNHYSNY